MLGLQQSAGNQAVLQLLRADARSGVQRLAVSDTFGTRDLPGYREGADARAEGEARAGEAGAVAGAVAERLGGESADAADARDVDVVGARDAQPDVAGPAAAHAGVGAVEESKADEVGLERTAPVGSGPVYPESPDATRALAEPAAEGDDTTDVGADGEGATGGVPDSAVGAAGTAPPDDQGGSPSGGLGGGELSGLTDIPGLAAQFAAPDIPAIAAPAVPDIDSEQPHTNGPAARRPVPARGVQRLADSDLDTSSLESIDLEELEATPDLGTSDTSGITGAADSMDSARPSGGGGVVDIALDQAMSWLRSAFVSATSTIRSGTSDASAQTETAGTSAEDEATDAMETTRGDVEQTATDTATEAGTEVSEAGGEVRDELTTTRSTIGSLIGRLTGTIRERIVAWLHTAGSDEEFVESIVAPIREKLQERIAALRRQLERIRGRLTAFVQRITTRLRSVVSRISTTLTNVVASVQRLVTRAIDTIRTAINSVIDRAVSVLRNVPALIADLISGLVNRAVATARRIVNLVTTAAQRVLDTIARGVTRLIERAAAAVSRIIDRIATAVTRVIDAVIDAIQRAITKVISAITRAINWVRERIRSIVQSVMKAVLGVVRRVIEEWLRPQLEAVMQQAQEAYEAFQRLLPQLREMAENAKREMEKALEDGVDRMTDLGGDALDALLNPDGDHFAIGGQLNAEVFGGTVGGGVSAGYTYDFIADYAHDQIGIFFTIAFGAGLNVGLGASAEVDLGVQMGWGTQYNLASKPNINEAAGGYNAQLGLGVSATAELEGGVAASFGHSFSMSLDTVGDVVCPKPPSGGPTPTPGPGPGPTPAPTPDPTPTPTPTPTPAEFDHHPLRGWTVLFPTGSATLDSADLVAIEDAARSIPQEVGQHPGGGAIVQVDGHASPRWRHPGPDQTAASENTGLSGERATNVYQALLARMPDVPGPLRISSAGRGDELARQEQASDDSDDQRFRAATIGGEVVVPRAGAGAITGGGGGGVGAGGGVGGGIGNGAGVGGAGATTGPGGTPPSTLSAFGCEVANQIPLDPVSSMLLTGTAPDDYLRARPYGWDTNAYLGVAGGAGASVSAGGSVGLSRAFPLWSTKLSPAAMDAVRLLFGLFKLGLDVATVSPVSFVRDAIGIAPAVENTVVPMLLGPLTSIEIPMPENA
jgi:outer membrane protein OmpA-like peptidoglycan-associated protein